MSALSSSLQRLNLRLLALQVFGNAGLLLAGALWLEIPDSHLWELALSLLFGAAIVSGFLLFHAFVIRRLRNAPNLSPLWLGAVFLALWLALLSLPSLLVDRISPATEQRASYWNSQLSPHLRTIFTYERLSHWQMASFDFVVWFLVPALLLPFLIETVALGVRGRAWRSGVRVLGQWKYWAGCIPVGVLLHFLILPLVDWQPGHTVAAEVFSVVLRLGVVYVAAVLLLTLLIAVTASLLARYEAVRDTTVQPVENHP